MYKVIIPSGISFNECEEIIEKIAINKAKQFNTIAYLDAEDIKQEVRIKCWSVLPGYDKHRSANLQTFLTVCADNRLRDIKRSLLFKFNKPCSRCEFNSTNGCVKYSNKFECKLYKRHERYIQTKLSTSHPVDIDTQRICDNGSQKFIDNFEFIDFVETHLPSGLMPLFRELASVNFQFKLISLKKRKVIKEHLFTIFQQFVGGKND